MGKQSHCPGGAWVYLQVQIIEESCDESRGRRGRAWGVQSFTWLFRGANHLFCGYYVQISCLDDVRI